MSDFQAAADAVLEGFVPIGDDHPRVREFEDAVAEHIAHRPSPTSEASQADRIESKLDEILSLLRGGSQ